MNHFLALRPADQTREELAAISERMRAWELPARWIHPDDFHLTVCFLGSLSPQEARAITWSIEDVASSLLPPQLALAGLGAVGGRREPRVVYAAIDDPLGYCADLHCDLQDALGERPEPNYKPHVTLCRPRSGHHLNSEAWRPLFEACGQAHWGAFQALDLVLYRSDPAGGRRYHCLERWALPNTTTSGAA